MISLIRHFIKKDSLVLLIILSFSLKLLFSLENYKGNKELKVKKLLFEEELAIREGLYRPRDIAINSHGSIYILDGVDQKIKMYDRKGTFLKEAGGKGEGPGETTQAFGISINESDRVYILDYNTGKINVFDSDLKFIRNIKTGVYYPFCFTVSKGRIYIAGPKELSSEKQNRKTIHILDIEGGYLSSFAPQHRYQGSLKSSQIPPNYAYPSVLLIQNDKLYVGYTYYYEIKIFKINNEMNLLNVIKRKGYFKDWELTKGGYKILMAGGLSLKIFPMPDGKLMHVYRIHTEEESKIYIDILKETGELLSSRIPFHPEEVIPCFFDRKQNKIYFIQNEPEPKIVRAHLKFIMQ